jgi:hypothetical protein
VLNVLRESRAKKLISFRIRPQTEEMITTIIKKSGLTQSDIIRSCLIVELPRLLDHYTSKKVEP